ncbi:hypothetical protein ACH5RR_006716 [Cinchona calisaya]|uniref:Uncharacterized protein n=1 Tax=Cinchona calisaya TaxID=153742 RepID=A0ABD3APT3_9GENT
MGIVVQVRCTPIDFRREIINAYYQILTVENSEYAQFKCTNIDYDLVLQFRLTLKKHDKAFQDWILKQQCRERAGQANELGAQTHGQQGAWESTLVANPDYVFLQPCTEADEEAEGNEDDNGVGLSGMS